MGVIQTLRDGVVPAVHSRRTPDPGKICEGPSCTKRFFRKPKETKKEYDDRTTCCKACKRELESHSPVKSNEITYKELDPSQLSCGNCRWMWDDPEVGDHCGPCTTGQNFMKRC